MRLTVDEYLAHYGMPRRSGRYPWGSGEDPYQSNRGFFSEVKRLKDEGMTDTEIAKAFGMTTTQFRAVKSMARAEMKQAEISMVQRLKDKGYSDKAISERTGLSESTVRNRLKPDAMDKAKILDNTAEMLKREVDNKGFIDVGIGVERYPEVGVSRNRLDTAVAKLEEEGYRRHKVRIQQVGTGEYTNVVVLTPPSTEYGEVLRNKHNIRQITEHTEDGGRTWLGLEPVQSIDSSRVQVRYAEEGGADADGVIHVRPGVDDVSLGGSMYAQVRIGVDDTHFMKGMAVYQDGLPPGVDLVYNTNKTRREAPTAKDVMKPMKRDLDGNIDQDNPFGATIARQSGVMNVIREEGEWATWTKNLSSQMLSKQSPQLAQRQLDMTFERKQQEFDEIMALTNPLVKKRLLESFAGDVDSSAVHLEAAAMPRQATSVLMPVQSLKPTEVYSPNHNNGDRVVLIRYPHGGIFEIPELTVNNRNREAQRSLGKQTTDAVGIHPSVANRLSGADFDGDTVLVIPNQKGAIKTAPALEKLKNFDPIRSYPAYEGMPRVKPQTMQNEMGNVSNLITDMTIKGATHNELARAVRHSMVVIDSEKHQLNYKQSALDNNIPQLKAKYQERADGGASTIISLASSTLRVPDRKPRPASEGGPIDPKTGRLVFVETGAGYTDKKGNWVPLTTKTTRLAEATDARKLSSGTKIEEVYAAHSNKLKGLANEARREYVSIKNPPYSKSAKAAYQNEVDSLNAKLNIALRNAPRERQAQIVANSIVDLKKQSYPEMTPQDLKKVRNQALMEARVRTGADKERIDITPREWEAIQTGAISSHKLDQILRNTDLEVIKKYATPRDAPAISNAMIARANSMAALGYTQAEIAAALGVSTSTVSDVIK